VCVCQALLSSRRMDRVLEFFWPFLWFQDVLSLRAGSCKCRDMVLSPTLLNPPSLPKPITPAPQLPYLPPVDVVEFQLRLQALPEQNPPINYYAFSDPRLAAPAPLRCLCPLTMSQLRQNTHHLMYDYLLEVWSLTIQTLENGFKSVIRPMTV